MSTTPTPEPIPSAWPKVYFAITQRVPPRVVYNADEAALLNPKEWTTIPPTSPREAVTYPKIMANVNLMPVVVNGPQEQEALGDSWVEYVPPDLTPVTITPASATSSASGTSSDQETGT